MRQACVGETGVDIKNIEESRNGYLADTPELRCYLDCLFQHSGMIDPDGSIHWRDVMHVLPDDVKETVVEVTKICETKRKQLLDKCDWVHFFNLLITFDFRC